jgi:hypothetical protein
LAAARRWSKAKSCSNLGPGNPAIPVPASRTPRAPGHST